MIFFLRIFTLDINLMKRDKYLFGFKITPQAYVSLQMAVRHPNNIRQVHNILDILLHNNTEFPAYPNNMSHHKARHCTYEISQ